MKLDKDIVFLVLNIIITIVSGYGAICSIRYYNKSKHITIYTKTNKALVELDKMLKRLPDALVAASTCKKGFSPENAVRDIGKELADYLTIIFSEIPADYSTTFRSLQKTSYFDLSKYIYCLIDGSAIIQLGERKTLDRTSFDNCVEQLREMQEYLKKKISEEEEKLK